MAFILLVIFMLPCFVPFRSANVAAATVDDEPKASQQSATDYLFGELSRLKDELQQQSREIEKLKSIRPQETKVNTASAGGDDANRVVSRSSASSSEFIFSELIRLRAELGKLTEAFNVQTKEVETLRTLTQNLNVKGTSYIRWGRTVCDGDSSTLYKGFAAGSKFTDRGAGSNYLCLHEQPQWSKIIPDVEHWTSTIYGVEYERETIFSYANNGGHWLSNHPAPCAVCYVPTRTAHVMIPARTECPTGWTKEYQGYIVAEHQLHHKGDYICWDGTPETATSASSQNHALIYQVEVICGSLPCSRFPTGHELACVVCTK